MDVDTLFIITHAIFTTFLIVALTGVSINRNMAERKRQAAKVEAARTYLQTLQESCPDSIIATNARGQITVFNPGAEELLGYQAAEVIGQPVDRLYPSREAAKAVMRAMRSDPGGRVRNLETKLRHKDGREIPVLISAAILRDATGQEQGTAGYSKDLTERKRAEEEMRQAREVAEAANRAKSEFLANMSHEIRTPLNAIIGMTGLLLDTNLTPAQYDYAQTIRSSGDALLAIINDILDFSKIEAGKLELERQSFDLRTCIEECLDLVAAKAAEKYLDLAYYIEDQTPNTLVGDVTRVRQILVNLLSNAVKFTEKGEVVVSVTAHPIQTATPTKKTEGTEGAQMPLVPVAPSYEVHFAVKDTGIGIPPDRMDRLFKSFSQVDASTTRRFGGTGLGLAISRRLAEMMGGTVWAESEIGQGSTFHVTILAEAAPSQPRLYLRGVQPRLTGKRLLIVDDNATNRRILSLQAQAWGMLPQAAACGAEALEWIRRGDPFDIAILDMHMPEMDGLTLATEIRKHRGPQILPLVMLTSLGQRVEADHLQFCACLTKPVKLSQLHDILTGIFAEQPAPGRDSTARPQIDPQMAQRHPLRILLAEDNAVNQKVALRILERLGYRADVAANGLEVLEALERQPYDVVLMDVQMPEMDGVEATRRIRERWPADRRPRLIAMTAHALSGDRELYLSTGMDDYIGKPVRVEELIAALERCQAIPGSIGGSSPTPAPTSEVTTSLSGEAIDRAALDRFHAMMGEDAPKLVAELIGIFLEDTPGLLAELRAALAIENLEGMCRAAHALKSSSASLGAMSLYALCQQLEAISRDGRPGEAAMNVALIEAEYERVKVALEAERLCYNS